MSEPKVFISYSHVDEKRWKNRLQKHLKVLEKHGSLSFWDDRRIAVGQEWRAEIKAALDSADAAILLISTDFLGSNFINDDEVPAILQRRISDGMKVFPLIVRSCPWQKVPWLEPLQTRPIDGKPLARFRGDDVDRILAELVSEIDALLNQPQLKQPAETETQFSQADSPTDECPYLGLEAFTEDKEYLFFGRDDFADALFDKVKRQNFVALIGPSGCGKSSVVQAGLFPRLRHDTQPWVPILFQPQANPFLSLAAEFMKRWEPQASSSVFINQAAKLAAELNDAQRLIEAIHRTVAAPDGRLLLVVDQFEEMFTLCDESDRRAFLDVLLVAKDVAPVTILLTLRADFMGQAQSFSSAFSQLLDESIVSHRPLTHADLEAVITGPARHSGLEFEPGLVNAILQEVAAQPDSLPLLEYALKEMWRKRQGRVMGHALYDAVGKVEGAISQHADTVLHALPEAEQRLALRALIRLVRVAGEEGEADTRLRLSLSELSEAERAVLQTFVTARLLVTKRKEGAGAETIEVAHEALIRRWRKLRESLDIDREFLMWRWRLDSRRKAWEQKGRDDKWLLYGGERDEAQSWLNGRDSELTAVEIEFITWDDRLDFQIERILSQSHSLLPYSYSDVRKSWFTTLVFCHEKARALSIAREIEDADTRGWALSSITQALAKMGLATESLTAAREIEGAYSRALALSSIAEALAKMGVVTEVREAATEALAAAREIEDAYRRAKVLSSLAKALVKAGMAKDAREPTMRALAAAREIENADYRARALSSIAKAQAKAGMAAQALATAHEIKDRDYYRETLRLIFEALVEAGMAMEALATAREIKDTDCRAMALHSIAYTLANVEMTTEAREVVREALFTTREIEDAADRAMALSSIATAMAKVEMVSDAFGAVTETIDTALKIDDADSRARALKSIPTTLAEVGLAAAESYVKAGLEAKAREAAMMALDAVDMIERENSRVCALNSIAEALMKAGMTTEAREAMTQARETATKALAAAREIEKAKYRAMSLRSIVDALVKAGMVTEALAAAREIENANDRAVALHSIASEMLEAGMVPEVLATARKIEYAFRRAMVLLEVTDFWLERRQDDDARNLLEETQSTVSKVFDDEQRSWLMRDLAIILARLHSYRAAREAAEQCSISSDRLAAYTAILREYYIERDPSLAWLFAEEKEDDDND
jgi:KaiC/GvpD/RAD55 family RecA-like ATPase